MERLLGAIDKLPNAKDQEVCWLQSYGKLLKILNNPSTIQGAQAYTRSKFYEPKILLVSRGLDPKICDNIYAYSLR